MGEPYIQIQNYFHDEWVPSKHKDMKGVSEEAKKFGDGDGLHCMPIGSSWFENDTYYYMDKMGHFVLFRGIDEFNKEYVIDKPVSKIKGNENFVIETVDKNDKT